MSLKFVWQCVRCSWATAPCCRSLALVWAKQHAASAHPGDSEVLRDPPGVGAGSSSLRVVWRCPECEYTLSGYSSHCDATYYARRAHALRNHPEVQLRRFHVRAGSQSFAARQRSFEARRIYCERRRRQLIDLPEVAAHSFRVIHVDSAVLGLSAAPRSAARVRKLFHCAPCGALFHGKLAFRCGVLPVCGSPTAHMRRVRAGWIARIRNRAPPSLELDAFLATIAIPTVDAPEEAAVDSLLTIAPGGGSLDRGPSPVSPL